MTTTTTPGRNDLTSSEMCFPSSTKKQHSNTFTNLHQAAKRDIKINSDNNAILTWTYYPGCTEILQNNLTTCGILPNDMKGGILTWKHVKPLLPDPATSATYAFAHLPTSYLRMD